MKNTSSSPSLADNTGSNEDLSREFGKAIRTTRKFIITKAIIILIWTTSVIMIWSVVGVKLFSTNDRKGESNLSKEIINIIAGISFFILFLTNLKYNQDGTTYFGNIFKQLMFKQSSTEDNKNGLKNFQQILVVVKNIKFYLGISMIFAFLPLVIVAASFITIAFMKGTDAMFYVIVGSSLLVMFISTVLLVLVGKCKHQLKQLLSDKEIKSDVNSPLLPAGIN